MEMKFSLTNRMIYIIRLIRLIKKTFIFYCQLKCYIIVV